jgi:hypothetical protein
MSKIKENSEPFVVGTTVLLEKVEEPEKYVVVRDDRRVSDHDYPNDDDPKAIEEWNFWQRVCTNWSPREKASIVKYNKKKHRNW